MDTYGYKYACIIEVKNRLYALKNNDEIISANTAYTYFETACKEYIPRKN